MTEEMEPFFEALNELTAIVNPILNEDDIPFLDIDNNLIFEGVEYKLQNDLNYKEDDGYYHISHQGNSYTLAVLPNNANIDEINKNMTLLKERMQGVVFPNIANFLGAGVAESGDKQYNVMFLEFIQGHVPLRSDDISFDKEWVNMTSDIQSAVGTLEELGFTLEKKEGFIINGSDLAWNKTTDQYLILGLQHIVPLIGGKRIPLTGDLRTFPSNWVIDFVRSGHVHDFVTKNFSGRFQYPEDKTYGEATIHEFSKQYPKYPFYYRNLETVKPYLGGKLQGVYKRP